MIGGEAKNLLLLYKDKFRFLTTPGKIRELESSLPYIAKKRGLDLEPLLLALEALPVEVVEESRFKTRMGDAHAKIAKRDITDVDLLALALAEDTSIWSEDKDFEDCGVKVYTTQQLLRLKYQA